MKNSTFSLCLGIAYCLWEMGKERKLNRIQFKKRFKEFLGQLHNEKKLKVNGWEWEVKEEEEKISFSLIYNKIDMYKGNYEQKKGILKSYFYYHSYLLKSEWEKWDNLMIEKLKSFVFLLEKKELSDEDKKALFRLKKQLKVIKIRNR